MTTRYYFESNSTLLFGWIFLFSLASIASFGLAITYNTKESILFSIIFTILWTSLLCFFHQLRPTPENYNPV